MPLTIIQFMNYFVAVGGLIVSAVYLFASDSFIREANNGIDPLNKYIVGVAYLVVAIMAGYLAYKLRLRHFRVPILYVVLNVAGFAFFEIINHFNGYRPSLTEYIFAFSIEAVIMGYLLLNKESKKYLNLK